MNCTQEALAEGNVAGKFAIDEIAIRDKYVDIWTRDFQHQLELLGRTDADTPEEWQIWKKFCLISRNIMDQFAFAAVSHPDQVQRSRDLFKAACLHQPSRAGRLWYSRLISCFQANRSIAEYRQAVKDRWGQLDQALAVYEAPSNT